MSLELQPELRSRLQILLDFLVVFQEGNIKKIHQYYHAPRRPE